MAKEQVKITISNRDAEELIKAAEESKIRPQEIARQAIKEYTIKRKWERTQRIGAKIAKELNIKTERDVLKTFFR